MPVRVWFKLDDEQHVDSVMLDATEIVKDVRKKIKDEGGEELQDVAVRNMEVGNKIRGYNQGCEANIAALYVSFNDYSSLQPWEQENPLQPLLRRIIFMATHNDRRKRNINTSDDFANKMWWLGDSSLTPCVLIVDELNTSTSYQKRIRRQLLSLQNSSKDISLRYRTGILSFLCWKCQRLINSPVLSIQAGVVCALLYCKNFRLLIL
eukprot:scaffold38788_cov221-Amphora_coffeaeformis.AAC.1